MAMFSSLYHTHKHDEEDEKHTWESVVYTKTVIGFRVEKSSNVIDWEEGQESAARRGLILNRDDIACVMDICTRNEVLRVEERISLAKESVDDEQQP